MPRQLPPAEALDLVHLADIARGGMGTVELARASGGRLDGVPLAVKRLNPELEVDPQFVNMFIDETWMTAAIASPHVIKVEAWGKDATGLYLACELVIGVSLSRLIKESKARKELFPERIVASVLRQICAGLEAAHGLLDETGASMNLVHRDLTPGNVLVGFDGLVKIADFGIAKANARLTETSAGVMKGKPSYMAPEQARGLAVDTRADLFSLGVITYELLAGQRPWVGSSDLEVLVAVSTKEPRDLGDLRRVDEVFLEITRSCLQKDASRRLASAREVGARLDRWLRTTGHGIDDAALLREFVARNTTKQHAWFERALGGSERGKDAFKDVEAQIDRARKPASSRDPRDGGRVPPAPPRHLGQTQAMVEPPRARADDDDLARTRYAGGPEVPRPVVMNLGGTISLSADEMASAMSHRPGGDSYPAPSSSRPELPRTQGFAAPQTPSGVGDLAPPPRSRAAPTMAWTPQAFPPNPSTGPASVPTAAMTPSMLAPPSSSPGNAYLTAPAPISDRGFVRQAAPPAPRRGGVGKVIAVVLVLALAAALVAAYFLRARFGL